jgi:hypothetical protein
MNTSSLLRAALGALLMSSACGDDGSTTDDGASVGTTEVTSGDSGRTAAPPAASDDSTGADSGSGTPADSSTGGGPATDSGGSDDSGSTGGQGLDIEGEWVEPFEGGGNQSHMITPETWTQDSRFGTFLFHVDGWDNALQVVVAQGDVTNDFNPELFSRFDWTHDSSSALFYCQSVYDAATAQDAWDAPGADDSDLVTGCAGFPWSPLLPLR